MTFTSFTGRCLIIGFVIALIACGKAIDPNAPPGHCVSGCPSNEVCQPEFEFMGAQCPADPEDCPNFDASVPHCPPCFTGGTCVTSSGCSSDDCDCILKAKCYNGIMGGKCWQTSSGVVEFYCYPA